jgi:predicted naringenin-chalcone synthase
MSESYLCAIGTATPPHRLPQTRIAEFMIRALQLDEEAARRLRVLYRASGIEARHTVVADYGREPADFTFYPPSADLEPFPTVSRRMAAYRAEAVPLSVAAAEACLVQLPDVTAASITHLITVSCTGMYAPGLDIDLVMALGLVTTVQRTAVNFMGCYAAFNGLKLADAICRADPAARVLVVCTELCTLHFQKHLTDDHLLSNALFADGAAAVLVAGEALPGAHPALALEAAHCALEPAGQAEMAWHIGDSGFEMTLSSYVPDLIRQGIGQLTEGLLRALGLQLPADVAHFAVHPGGRRILEVIEQALQLPRTANRHAYAVLREYGNMSSATVLFVLQHLLADLTTANHDERVLSFAFGPGLTLESLLFRVVAPAVMVSA